MPSTSFKFGAQAEHEVCLVFGLLGSEQYIVNGVCRRKHWSLMPSGSRVFEAEGHQIEIRVSIGLKAVQAQALVDGQVVADDLFAHFNQDTQRRNSAKALLKRFLLIFLFFLVTFTLIKQLERCSSVETQSGQTDQQGRMA